MTVSSKSLFPAKALGLSFAAVCLAGTALVNPALAQDALPEISVTSPTTVPTPVNQIASSITVITAADLERDQRRTLSDALQTVPGLNVVQSGGPGGQTSVFMRGTNSNHTKILIDGIDVGDSSTPNGAYDLGQLTTGDIDRIEVLRGPQSGLYGSDAIGGVISITTKKGQGPAKVTSMVEGGSRGTANAMAGVSGSQDRFNYAFNVSSYHTASTPVTPLELLQPGQQRNNDSFTNRTASTKLGYDFNEVFGLNFVGRYTDSKLSFTGDQFPSAFPDGIPGDVQSSQSARQFFTRSEAVVSLFDGRFKNYFGFNYTDQARFNINPYSFSGFSTVLKPAYTTNEAERFKYDWRGVISVLEGQTVVLGAESQIERFNNSNAAGKAFRAETGNRGAYAELQSNFANRFFVVSNVRVDDHDTFGEHSTYRVAPAFIVPGTETKLKASYGTGFKAPTLSQLYDTNYGNTALKPEESTGYDVGFEQPIANDRARFGTTYFNNKLKNLINNDPFTYQYFNIDRARTSGFESFVSLAIDKRFSVRFDHTYTEAIDETTGLYLRRRPRHKASVSSIWNPTDDLNLSATVIWLGDFQDVDRYAAYPYPSITAPGYTIVNLAANYTLAPGVVTFARIDNLFNEQYQDPTGFMRPGFGIFGGVRLAGTPFTR